MALPTAVQIDGRWCADPGDGTAPTVCATHALANQVVAAMIAGGFWEVTFRLSFGSTVPPASEVTKVKAV